MRRTRTFAGSRHRGAGQLAGALIGLAAALAVVACAAGSRPPEEAAAPARPDDDAEMARALAELDARKAELARHRGVGDCDEVCQLARLVCSAGERVCAIAGRHRGNPDYAGRCRGAQDDCKQAQAQCEGCR